MLSLPVHLGSRKIVVEHGGAPKMLLLAKLENIQNVETQQLPFSRCTRQGREGMKLCHEKHSSHSRWSTSRSSAGHTQRRQVIEQHFDPTPYRVTKPRPTRAEWLQPPSAFTAQQSKPRTSRTATKAGWGVTSIKGREHKPVPCRAGWEWNNYPH